MATRGLTTDALPLSGLPVRGFRDLFEEFCAGKAIWTARGFHLPSGIYGPRKAAEMLWCLSEVSRDGGRDGREGWKGGME